MVKPVAHEKVKLVIGLISSSNICFEKAIKILVKKFGSIDFESELIDFNYTSYYEKEFGKNLKRKFICFKKLIPQGDISNIKVITNKIERYLSSRGKRLVNIDPGYLSLSKFVLATTKDFSHRIYLDKDIFAEITLIFLRNRFISLPWTYPDYKSAAYLNILHNIREIYETQIKA